MDTNTTMTKLLEFVTNNKAREGHSPLKSQVEIDGKPVIVFPHRDFTSVFQEPGLYWVEIELREGATFLFAKPVPIRIEDAIKVINAVSEHALSNA